MIGKLYIVTPEQLRAARALLDWTQPQLAERAGVGEATVRNYEAGIRQPSPATQLRIKDALERGGVIFIEENGGGPGVRLRRRGENEGPRGDQAD